MRLHSSSHGLWSNVRGSIKSVGRAAALCYFLCAFIFPAILSGDITQSMGQADRAVREGKFNEAVAAYLKVLNYAKDREKQIVWDDLGYAYLKKGETALAQRYLERSQDAFPFDYDVKLYMALASDRLGDPASALRFLQVIEKDLFFDDRWFDMARPLKIKNDLGDRVPVEALERMRKIKGVFLLRKGEDEGVLIVDVFNEKNLGLYRYFKGLLLRDLGVPDDAALEFREAGQAGFEIPAGRNPRDEILSRLRHRYKLHPGDLAWFAHEKFLKILEQGNIKEAIRSLEEGLDSDCRSFWMNHNLALLLYDTDDLSTQGALHERRTESHCRTEEPPQVQAGPDTGHRAPGHNRRRTASSQRPQRSVLVFRRRPEREPYQGN